LKSIRVLENQSDFQVCEVDKPVLTAQSAVIRMEAAFFPPYLDLLAKEDWLTPEKPFTPGQCAIGIVESINDPLSSLEVGQRVYCDMYIESHVYKDKPDHGFIGCFGPFEGAAKHFKTWRDGSFCEFLHVPTECLTPVPKGLTLSPSVLCRLGWFATAYEAFNRSIFKPGMSVAINGATGLLGTCAALMAVALGAKDIYVFGRRASILKELSKYSTSIKIVEEIETCHYDVMIDCAGGDNTSVTEDLISKLAYKGQAVFIGALTQEINVDTSLLMRNQNTLMGSFWFERVTASLVMAMIESGKLDLSILNPITFELDDIKKATDVSLNESGGFRHVSMVCK
jgi:threonine dehydrogenase-like Zn-dependent dehydrogenase